MSEQLKTLKARVQHKHKTEKNWLKDIYSDVENQVFQTKVFRPLPGELIIYDRDENYSYERYKIGRQDPDEAEGVGLQLHLLEFVDGNINTLTTMNKNFVGAINELNTDLYYGDGIIGTWMFNDALALTKEATYEVEYLYNGHRYDSISIYSPESDIYVMEFYSSLEPQYSVLGAYDTINGWGTGVDKTIIIIKEPEDTEFGILLKANAKKQKSSLETEEQSIVGAINELHDEIGDISTVLDTLHITATTIIGGN